MKMMPKCLEFKVVSTMCSTIIQASTLATETADWLEKATKAK